MERTTLIIPCFNETQNLATLFQEIALFQDVNGELKEIIFVDDGSTDATQQMLDLFVRSSQGNARVVTFANNRGKGAAVREGVLSAKGDFCVVLDADLSVPLIYIKSVVDQLSQGAVIVIGNRRMKGSYIVAPQGLIRHTMGALFVVFTKVLLGIPTNDITCGCKGFLIERVQVFFRDLQTFRWGYDAEVLFRATQAGISFVEIPIVWAHKSTSKVRIWRDSIRTFFEIIKIRFSIF